MGKIIIITLQPAYMKYFYIHIPAKFKDWLPVEGTKVQIQTDDLGVLETSFYPSEEDGPGIHRGGVRQWFKAHPELKKGNEVRITVIDPKKYRLEIIK